MIVSAHNGYPHWLNSGADFMEVDIRRTSQEVLVLAHDVLRPNSKYVELDEVLDAACGKIGLQLDPLFYFRPELLYNAVAQDTAYVTDQALSFGVPIWLWTVDDARLMERIFKEGRVAGLITNRPDRALRLRSGRS